MSIQRFKSLLPHFRTELRSILDFWMHHMPDEENGGFWGEMDGKGSIRKNAEKGAVLNARILWTFSAAYNFAANPAYLEMASRAFHYLSSHFWDVENGGLYWSLQANGKVKNSRKQAYAQGFGMYAFAEYYRATQNPESLTYAQQLYGLLEKHFKDPEYRGYIEALSDTWAPLTDMRLSEKDANFPKSMNTHLHIIEPYTNLYRVWPDAALKKSIEDLLAIFQDHIVHPTTHHFQLFFDMDWTVRSGIVSYGHDIEGAWLLNEAAHFIQNKAWQQRMQTLSIQMADTTMAEGLDHDGSLFYEKENGHLDTDKHWWPQAEAMVGFLDAYQQSKQVKYLLAAEKAWQFISIKLVDRDKGEWYWKVDRNGVPDAEPPKAGFWKCPYHNTRALIEVINRLNALEE